jgi:hypothetical protein
MVKARLDDPLTADQLRTLLDYHPKLGLFFWRPREPLRQYDRTWNTRYAGKQAGTPTVPRGYVQILVNTRLYLAHRLAYLWMNGAWPTDEIDHRDGDPANNRWDNLREATSSQNKMNNRMRSDNSSGHKGVHWNTRRRKWCAEVWIDGKKHVFGFFASVEDAVAARDNGARRLHGDYRR